MTALTGIDRLGGLVRSSAPKDSTHSKTKCVDSDASLNHEVERCEEICRESLALDFIASIGHLPLAPQSPEASFELLLGIPYDARRVELVRRMKRVAEKRGVDAPFALERYLVLQSYLEALPKLLEVPLHDSLKRQYCQTCRDIASTPEIPDKRLSLESDAFAELAQIVTLRRFHAGQCSIDVMSRIPLAWLLKVHPFDLPGFVWELCFRMGGLGPVVEPHTNYWRANQLFLLKREHERAIWRLAQFVKERPEIKGLISSSWLYGVETKEAAPHLGWLREFYVAENAKVLDAGPALTNAGFLVGSDRRREQFANGLFRPRETIVLWPRADLVDWACRHPEFGAGAAGIASAVTPTAGSRSEGPPPRRWRSGRWTLIDCRALLYYRPRRYVALVLAVPALVGASLAAGIWSIAAIAPVFGVLLACLWLLQYLFLQ